MGTWQHKEFEKCLTKVTYTNKIQQFDFKESGKYPIISQNAEFISGYWDNDKDVFKLSKPVVIFGDHTRCLKYIDFDFVLGADGVKIQNKFAKIVEKVEAQKQKNELVIEQMNNLFNSLSQRAFKGEI